MAFPSDAFRPGQHVVCTTSYWEQHDHTGTATRIQPIRGRVYRVGALEHTPEGCFLQLDPLSRTRLFCASGFTAYEELPANSWVELLGLLTA